MWYSKGLVVGVVWITCLVGAAVAEALATRVCTAGVHTLDFIGITCSGSDGQSASGRWILDNGGTFEGKTNITLDTVNVGAYTLSKGGTMKTATFEGMLNLLERKYKNAAGIFVTEVREDLTGKETLPDGGLLDGRLQTFMPGDGSRQITKSGALKTPSFEGNLIRSERKYRDASGVMVTEGYEELRGTWIIAPDEKLTGVWSIRRNADGTVTVRDGRVRVAP